MGVDDKVGDLKNAVTGGVRTRDWDQDASHYRAYWQDRYGRQGGRWEDSEPSYRYGWETVNDPRYHNRSWSDAEPELRRDWETRKGRPPWDQAKDWVRDAWQKTIQLREEELVAHKRQVETGAVTVGKDVVEERKSVDVPVTREEVVVERHAVDRRPASGSIGTDETIKVPVQEEQVDVEKRTVVREEVNVSKRAVQDTEHVTDTIRREELRVDTEGDVRDRTDNRDRPPTRR